MSLGIPQFQKGEKKKAVGGGGKEMKGGKERKRERAFCVGNMTTYLGVII